MGKLGVSLVGAMYDPPSRAAGRETGPPAASAAISGPCMGFDMSSERGAMKRVLKGVFNAQFKVGTGGGPGRSVGREPVIRCATP